MEQKQEKNVQQTFRFKRFAHKRYAAFSSLHRMVSIGVVAATTLAYSLPANAEGHAWNTSEGSSILLDEVEKTTEWSETAPANLAKQTTIISAKDIAAAPVSSVQDLLEYVSGVDVRQRGDAGVQADVSLRGGTHDQVVVLLNGINITNPHTGHYSFDLPVTLADIARIEIIYGPAAHTYGVPTLTGAINIVTRTPSKTSLEADLSLGNHAQRTSSLAGSLAGKQLSSRASASYSASNGYTTNTDYELYNLYWQGNARTSVIDLSGQVGYNHKAYGANSFYSAAYPNQFDKTSRLFTSLQLTTHTRLPLTLNGYWSESNDRYKLFRDNPAAWYTGDNFHRANTYGVSLRTHWKWIAGTTSTGILFHNESILSNVLGFRLDTPQPIGNGIDQKFTHADNRHQLTYSLDHSVTLGGWSLSAGAMLVYSSSINNPVRVMPGIDAAYRFENDIKLYVSGHKGMRLPSFTDLFYESKTTKGNANLVPEESYSAEIGAVYSPYFITAQATLFYRRSMQVIDWIKKNPEDVWESRNLTQLDNAGVELSADLSFRQLLGSNFFLHRLKIGYTYIHQSKESGEYISNYALNHLRHHLTASLTHDVAPNITATWSVRYNDRAGNYTLYEAALPVRQVDYTPYASLDINVCYRQPMWELYLAATNLTNATYYDLGNIPQPGILFRVGARIHL